jgi:hypothetical protein
MTNTLVKLQLNLVKVATFIDCFIFFINGRCCPLLVVAHMS